MGAGIFILPIVLILFFVLPIALALFGNRSKRTRFGLLGIPATVIVLLISVIVSDMIDARWPRYPEINKLEFGVSHTAVRDSLKELRLLMCKLPRWQGRVVYSIDKHPIRYGEFSFNHEKIGKLYKLPSLEDNGQTLFPENNLSQWVSSGKLPFEELSETEKQRLIVLIEFLDRNNINEVELNNFDLIAATYNDPLARIDGKLGRKIVLDTSSMYSSEYYYHFDNSEGMHLVKRVNRY